MAKQQRKWVMVKALTAGEKAAIAAACERFIAGVLKPRCLPEICPTQFNYPIDITGKWRGSKYSFILRYRSGFPENAGKEFDSAFTRLDHVDEEVTETRFNVMWQRHNGQWLCLCPSATLEEALDLIETNPALWPPV